MAEAVFRHHTKPSDSPHHQHHPQIADIDSAGTGAYHIDSDPDSRTMSTLRDHGIDSYRHKARKFVPSDFNRFDYVFAMDNANLEDLEEIWARLVKDDKKGDDLAKLLLWGDFGGMKGEEVVDPYYGGNEGFDTAYEQMERFTKGFLKHIEEGG